MYFFFLILVLCKIFHTRRINDQPPHKSHHHGKVIHIQFTYIIMDYIGASVYSTHKTIHTNRMNCKNVHTLNTCRITHTKANVSSTAKVIIRTVIHTCPIFIHPNSYHFRSSIHIQYRPTFPSRETVITGPGLSISHVYTGTSPAVSSEGVRKTRNPFMRGLQISPVTRQKALI